MHKYVNLSINHVSHRAFPQLWKCENLIYPLVETLSVAGDVLGLAGKTEFGVALVPATLLITAAFVSLRHRRRCAAQADGLR